MASCDTMHDVLYLMFWSREKLSEEVHDGISCQVLGTYYHMVILAGLSGVILPSRFLPLHPQGTNALYL